MDGPMLKPVNDHPTRRQIIQGSLFAAAAALISGCQKPTVATDIPGPVWPDMEGGRDGPLPPVATAPPPVQAPSRPSPNTGSAQLGGVIPRSRWAKGAIIESRVNPMRRVTRITVHHEGITFYGSTDLSAIARKLENIRMGHIRRKPEPFGDIGYHYIIDPAGRIWEGRNIAYQGAHVERQNENNLGIMVMGNFEEQRPTAQQLSTLDAFVKDRMRAYNVPVSRVYTHLELGKTECPGRNLQRWMLAQRSPGGTFARA